MDRRTSEKQWRNRQKEARWFDYGQVDKRRDNININVRDEEVEKHEQINNWFLNYCQTWGGMIMMLNC